jgi:two-component system response regulator TtrR
MMSQPLIHLVDDDPSVRDACRFLLEGYGFDVVYWPDGGSFLADAELHTEGCLILDMRPPGLDGTQVHARLRDRQSTLGVIVLTAHGDVAMAVEEMKHGAVDFLQKPVSGHQLLEAIERGLARSRQQVAQQKLLERVASLSEREREVAELVAQGLTNREMADRLCLAVRTIEVHRANAIRKLDIERSVDLVRLWQQMETGGGH